MSAFGDYIREQREARGWTRRRLANAAYWSGGMHAYIGDLEEGAFDADFLDVALFARAFGADLAHLLRLSGCALPDGLALVEDEK